MRGGGVGGDHLKEQLTHLLYLHLLYISTVFSPKFQHYVFSLKDITLLYFSKLANRLDMSLTLYYFSTHCLQ